MKISTLVLFLSLILLVSNTVHAIEIAGVEMDLEEEGCKKVGNSYYCLQEASLYEAPGRFVENILCVSSEDNSNCAGAACAEIMDFGCASTIELERDMSTEFFYKKITGEESTNEYAMETLPKGNYEIVIDPEIVDFTKCTKSSNEWVYLMDCAYTNTRITFNAEILAFDEDYEFVVFDISAPGAGGADVVALIWDNIIYIALIAIIAIVAIQMFRSKKPSAKKSKKPRKPI